MIAARSPGLRGGPAPDPGRAGRGATKREGLPDVQGVFRSGGGAAAAQCALGQANTLPKLSSVPPSAGEPVPVGTKTCRLIFLFTVLRRLADRAAARYFQEILEDDGMHGGRGLWYPTAYVPPPGFPGCKAFVGTDDGRRRASPLDCALPEN